MATKPPELVEVETTKVAATGKVYQTGYDAVAGEWVGTYPKFPSLSHVADTREKALAGITELVADVEADLGQGTTEAHRTGFATSSRSTFKVPDR